MATYTSTTEEEARRRLSSTSPMTSLTSGSINTTTTTAPKTTTSVTSTAPTVAGSTSTTTTAPKPSTTLATVGTQAPTNSTGTTQTEIKPTTTTAPIIGTGGATGTASGTTATSITPEQQARIDAERARESGGTGDVSMADGYEKIDTSPISTQQQSGDGGAQIQMMSQQDDLLTDWFTNPDLNLDDAMGATDTATGTGSPNMLGDPFPGFGDSDGKDLGSEGGIFDEDNIIGDNDPGIDREAVPSDPNIDDMLEDFVRSGLSGDEYDDVTIDADPYQDVSIDHETDREMDKASRANIMKLLGYDEGDTGDEEAYIEKRVADRLGQQLVGARASMGRAGFGSSGALYGMENDQRRQANLDAEGRIYDVREREQNQAFDRNMAGAGLADRRDERLYDRAVDNADLDFRNQDERYGRATDAADNDYRNQTTEFGQKMDVANLDQQGRQGARQDAILKSQMDAVNAMLGSASDDSGPTPPRSTNAGDGADWIGPEDIIPIGNAPNAPEAAYSDGSSYMGSDSDFHYYVNAQNQVYKVARPDPNSADKDDLRDAVGG